MSAWGPYVAVPAAVGPLIVLVLHPFIQVLLKLLQVGIERLSESPT